MKKRFLAFERHSNAPELNKIHYVVNSKEGKRIEKSVVRKVDSIKHYRQLMARPKSGRYAIIKYINEKYPALSRTYQGYVSSYGEVLAFIKNRNQYHNVEGGTFNISLSYIP